MFDKVIARATILAALVSSSLAFLLHAGCRATNYQVDVFNRFCYSDLAVYVQEGVIAFSGNSPAVAPLSHVLLWILGVLPSFEYKVVVLQLIMTLALVITALTLQVFRGKNTYDGVLFVILPFTPLTMFVGFDVLAIAVASIAIFLYKKSRNSYLPWALFAIAIGIDGWTWIVVASVIVYEIMDKRIADLFQRLPVLVLTLGVINIPIALTTRNFFNITPVMGDGTAGYILSQIGIYEAPTNFTSYFFGLLVLGAFSIWLFWRFKKHRFRFELVLLLFVCVQTLSTNAITAGGVSHVLWALFLAYPVKNFIIGISTLFTFWVAAVWLHAEILVGDRGIDFAWYVIAAVLVWTSIFYSGFKAVEIVQTPGKDPVLNGNC
jgi:hypothetical protein